MNAAILIGIKNYSNLKELLSCKRDVEIMHQIVKHTDKFEHILFIDTETNKQAIMDEIIRFVEALEAPVDEILFYYSGHGNFDDEENEFYYLCTDYKQTMRHSTAIKNKELDDILRSLNPKLCVKIVDACESGVRYIKSSDSEMIKGALSKTKEEYKNCYFMFSSMDNQKSLASRTGLSLFTGIFVKAIMNLGGTIRYRSIIDYITDEFTNSNESQTPYFLTQSTNREYFSNDAEVLVKGIESYCSSSNIDLKMLDNKPEVKKSLIEAVKEDAARYTLDLSDLQAIVKDIIEQIRESFHNEEMTELFEYKIEELNSHFKPGRYYSDIANELKRKNNYFIEVQSAYNHVTSKPYYGFIPTQEIPVNNIIIQFYPKHQNICKYNCDILFAFSKIELTIGYGFSAQARKDWEKFENISSPTWHSVNIHLKNNFEIKNAVEQIKNEFFNYVEEDVRQNIPTA